MHFIDLLYIDIYIYIKKMNYCCLHTDQNYECNTFVFAPIFKQKAYFSQMLFTNLSKSVLVSTSPLPR